MGETFLAIGDFCPILLLYQLKLGFFGWNFNITAVQISVQCSHFSLIGLELFNFLDVSLLLSSTGTIF